MGDQSAPNNIIDLEGDEFWPLLDEVEDLQMGDQPTAIPTVELQGDEFWALSDEVEDLQMGDQPMPNPTIELQGDEIWPLSDKPFFDIILTKSHVKPMYQMVIPARFQEILPTCSIPTVLTVRGKNWEMTYNGSSHKRFDTNWRGFANDNNLKAGDACVFELLDCSSTRLEFRVQILRGDLPSEFQDKIHGETVRAPIVIE